MIFDPDSIPSDENHHGKNTPKFWGIFLHVIFSKHLQQANLRFGEWRNGGETGFRVRIFFTRINDGAGVTDGDGEVDLGYTPEDYLGISQVSLIPLAPLSLVGFFM